MYEILFSTQAEKFFKKLKEKPLKKAYKKSLLKLAEDPYIGQPKHGFIWDLRLRCNIFHRLDYAHAGQTKNKLRSFKLLNLNKLTSKSKYFIFFIF